MASYKFTDNFSDSQITRKKVCVSSSGIVTAQHKLAALEGAKIMAAGGNAIDAAITTSFALGVLEPWMSGLGGGGAMLIYEAKTDTTHAIDFGMRSSNMLDLADYPLTGGIATDLFPWPVVKNDHNLHGPGAIAIPGVVDGARVAFERFGRLPWNELIQPAIDLASQGPLIDANTSLMITGSAVILDRYPVSRNIYFRNGFPAVSQWTANADDRLDFSLYADTLKHLAEAGPRDFYEGDLARSIIADLNELGSPINQHDMASYQAKLVPALNFQYREASLAVVPGLTAGPTLKSALELLATRGSFPNQPDGAIYRDYVTALAQAYQQRLAEMGDDESRRGDTCTTHFSVVDAEGNMVAMTQTLLSAFGSKVTLPKSGILMNNGIMWFDPEPGKPNSLAAGKRCLMNVCPAMGKTANGRFAIGASGGRKIMPAVMQLASFMSDFGMDLEEAFHQPRIDMSGGEVAVIDQKLGDHIISIIAEEFPVSVTRRLNYPFSFACPAGVYRADSKNYGMTEIMSLWGDAKSADDVTGPDSP